MYCYFIGGSYRVIWANQTLRLWPHAIRVDMSEYISPIILKSEWTATCRGDCIVYLTFSYRFIQHTYLNWTCQNIFSYCFSAAWTNMHFIQERQHWASSCGYTNNAWTFWRQPSKFLTYLCCILSINRMCAATLAFR